MMHLKLFWLFFKLGALSFGGGYPMMALIFEEGSKSVGLTTAEFADMAALELMASGPIAVNGATYVGYIKAGFSGAIVATLAVCLPSFILVSIVYHLLKKHKENPVIQSFLSSIRIACAGILFATALNLAETIFNSQNTEVRLWQIGTTNVKWLSVLLCAACLAAMCKKKANPIVVILAAAAAGAFLL